MSTRRIILSLAVFAAAAAPLNAQVYYSRAVPRGWLGISFTQLEKVTGGQNTSTVVITEVSDASPAQRAGIQTGDTILRVNDFRATSDLLGSMGSSVEPGDTVRLVVRRTGRERTIPVVVAPRPANLMFADARTRYFTIDPDSVRGRARLFVDSMYAGLDTTRFRASLRFDTLTGFRALIADSMIFHQLPSEVFQYRGMADSALHRFRALVRDSAGYRDLVRDSMFQRFEVTTPSGAIEFGVHPGNIITSSSYLLGGRAFGGADLSNMNAALGEYFGARQGVLVLRVPKGTPADRAGLEAGDVVTTVNGTAVASIAELHAAVEKVAPRTSIRLEALRHGKAVSLEMRRN